MKKLCLAIAALQAATSGIICEISGTALGGLTSRGVVALARRVFIAATKSLGVPLLFTVSSNADLAFSRNCFLERKLCAEEPVFEFSGEAKPSGVVLGFARLQLPTHSLTVAEASAHLVSLTIDVHEPEALMRFLDDTRNLVSLAELTVNFRGGTLIGIDTACGSVSRFIARHQNLRTLALTWEGDSSQSVPRLEAAALAGIRHLIIRGFSCRNALGSLLPKEQLDTLDILSDWRHLESSHLTNDDIHAIASLPHLRRLACSHCLRNASDLSVVTNAMRLIHLHLEGVLVDRMSPFDGIASIHFGSCGLASAALYDMRDMTALCWLVLHRCYAVGESIHLNQIKAPRQLRCLSVQTRGPLMPWEWTTIETVNSTCVTSVILMEADASSVRHLSKVHRLKVRHVPPESALSIAREIGSFDRLVELLYPVSDWCRGLMEELALAPHIETLCLFNAGDLKVVAEGDYGEFACYKTIRKLQIVGAPQKTLKWLVGSCPEVVFLSCTLVRVEARDITSAGHALKTIVFDTCDLSRATIEEVMANKKTIDSIVLTDTLWTEGANKVDLGMIAESLTKATSLRSVFVSDNSVQRGSLRLLSMSSRFDNIGIISPVLRRDDVLYSEAHRFVLGSRMSPDNDEMDCHMVEFDFSGELYGHAIASLVRQERWGNKSSLATSSLRGCEWTLRLPR